MEPGSILCIIVFRWPPWLLCGLVSWTISRCVFMNSHVVVIVQPTARHVMKMQDPSLNLWILVLYLGTISGWTFSPAFWDCRTLLLFKTASWRIVFAETKISRMNLQQFPTPHLHSIQMNSTTRFNKSRLRNLEGFAFRESKSHNFELLRWFELNQRFLSSLIKPWWNKFMCWNSVWLSG